MCLLRMMLVATLMIQAAVSESPGDAERDVIRTLERVMAAIVVADNVALQNMFMPDAKIIDATPLSLGVSPTALRGKLLSTRPPAIGKLPMMQRIWNPKVNVWQDLATAWVFYDIHVDGRRRECGAEAFTLVRTDKVWKIAGGFVFPGRLPNCPDNPFPPLP